MTESFISKSPNETETIGRELALSLSAGDVVSLRGTLGVGKTVFVRGMLSGLGYAGHVPSPTFTFANEYETPRLTAAHFDLYRASDEETLSAAGLYEYLGKSLIIVEWGDKSDWIREEATVSISISGTGEQSRVIVVERRNDV